MKKLITIIISTALILSITTTSMAEDTELTATVPAAQYTLNIPADQEIEFGATDTVIGNVTVTDSKYFAENKNLEVTVAYDDFKAEGEERSLPFVLKSEWESVRPTGTNTYYGQNTYESGSKLIFKGQKDTSVYSKVKIMVINNYTFDQDELHLIIDSSKWARLYPADYSTTITFSAEVVYPD